MTPLTKILPALIALALITGAASAQQRTLYDASGNVVGRSATDSQGTVTNYDSRGRVVSRESTSGGTTTIYDDRGRNVARIITNLSLSQTLSCLAVDRESDDDRAQ
jgi:YD repeat-containing protein